MINTFSLMIVTQNILVGQLHLMDELKGKFGEYVDVENIGLGSKSEKERT